SARTGNAQINSPRNQTARCSRCKIVKTAAFPVKPCAGGVRVYRRMTLKRNVVIAISDLTLPLRLHGSESTVRLGLVQVLWMALIVIKSVRQVRALTRCVEHRAAMAGISAPAVSTTCSQFGPPAEPAGRPHPRPHP